MAIDGWTLITISGNDCMGHPTLRGEGASGIDWVQVRSDVNIWADIMESGGRSRDEDAEKRLLAANYKEIIFPRVRYHICDDS